MKGIVFRGRNPDLIHQSFRGRIIVNRRVSRRAESVWEGHEELLPAGRRRPSFVFQNNDRAGTGCRSVHATGVRTELGKIGKALQTLESRAHLCRLKPVGS